MKDVIHIYLDHVEFKLFMDKDKLHQKEIAVLNSFQERVHYNVTWKRVIETLFLVVLKRMLCISVGCVDNPFYVRYFYASYGEDRFFFTIHHVYETQKTLKIFSRKLHWPIIAFMFRLNSSYTQTMNRKTMIMPAQALHSCTKCGKVFPRKDTLIQHLTTCKACHSC